MKQEVMVIPKPIGVSSINCKKSVMMLGRSLSIYIPITCSTMVHILSFQTLDLLCLVTIGQDMSRLFFTMVCRMDFH